MFNAKHEINISFSRQHFGIDFKTYEIFGLFVLMIFFFKFLIQQCLQISSEDSLPKNICYTCKSILKQFEILFNLSIENEEKLQKALQLQKSREEAKQIEDDLAEIGLMLSDGNNLTSNFAANQGDDDDSDKSLEIPGSLETDLAKDIDR